MKRRKALKNNNLYQKQKFFLKKTIAYCFKKLNKTRGSREPLAACYYIYGLGYPAAAANWRYWIQTTK
jgi:hypothetical protein